MLTYSAELHPTLFWAETVIERKRDKQLGDEPESLEANLFDNPVCPLYDVRFDFRMVVVYDDGSANARTICIC